MTTVMIGAAIVGALAFAVAVALAVRTRFRSRPVPARPAPTRVDTAQTPTFVPSTSFDSEPAPSRGFVMSGPRAWATAIIVGLLTAGVVTAPNVLSSRGLTEFAKDQLGLTTGIWPYYVFIALDMAVGLCIVLTVIAAFRQESGGAAHAMVWVLAGLSALSNYEHGNSIRESAPAAWWFFPSMSIGGALLLEVVVRKVRRWVLADAGGTERPLPRFRFVRWVVASRETWMAWRLAVTESLTRPEDAIALARHVRAGAAQTDRVQGAPARPAAPAPAPVMFQAPPAVAVPLPITKREVIDELLIVHGMDVPATIAALAEMERPRGLAESEAWPPDRSYVYDRRRALRPEEVAPAA